MKRVLLLLLLAVPVSAASFISSDYVNGNINNDQFSLVTVEREKKVGSRADDRMTCINTNKNYYCERDEPRIGECFANVCIWPTATFKPWYSWRYRSAPCTGIAILAGQEYTPLLQWAKCTKEDSYWCCDPYAFPTLESGLTPKPSTQPPGPSPTGALLVLDAQKWRALERGHFKYQKYEQRAYEAEKQRCAKGGGQIRIIDRKYGSFFSDVKNLRPGTRAFFVKPDEVIPLVTWC